MSKENEMSTMAEPETTETPVDERPLPSPTADQIEQITRGGMYLNVDLHGTGAADCPQRGERVDGEWVGDGKCDNPDHFHAWLRPLNPFQTNQVHEKALAARARRRTLLETEGTDANVVFESTLTELRQAVAEGGESLVRDELVGMHKFVDQIEAWGTVAEREEWEGIGPDRERLAELELEAEDNPDAPISDEHQILRDRVKGFYEALKAEERALQAPRYAELDGLSVDELIDRVRLVRLETETLAEFMHVRAWDTWFLGTYRTTRNAKNQHRTRMYATEDELKDEDEEVLAELQQAFATLSEPTARRAEGNS